MSARRIPLLALLALTLAPRAGAQDPIEKIRGLVDSYWGDGLPTPEKLQIFDQYWSFADSAYAAFHHLDLDWDAVRATYRPEIETGVSRGRFAGIMNHVALSLREPHTYAIDSLVNINTDLPPGVPLLLGAVFGDNGHFGACLTPQEDGSLLVYAAVADHPLGLAVGDAVLGYDGTPWKELYAGLLDADIPLYSRVDSTRMHPAYWNRPRWGSAPSAFHHTWMIAAGLNWHLFETLDYVDASTLDTIRVSVDPLEHRQMQIRCTEQMPVSGVAPPDPDSEQYVSWGVVDGTRIGYVYVWSWRWREQRDNFRRAVEELVLTESVDALIVDYRFNHGGFPHYANEGYAILFESMIETLGTAQRVAGGDHLAMQEEDCCVLLLDIPGDPSSYFDKPIAVLTGPGAYSAGDYNAVRLGYHPRTRFFGKSTSASFAAARSAHVDTPGWFASASFFNAYVVQEPERFLTHTEQRVDEHVWLERSDVMDGEDTVVMAALRWIESVVLSTEDGDREDELALAQSYPNPVSGQATIEFDLPASGGSVVLTIYNALGQRVGLLMQGRLAGGRHAATLDASGLAPGLYFYELLFGDSRRRRALLVAH